MSVGDILKNLVSRLPTRLQNDLRRYRFRRQIRARRFVTSEPEFSMLDRWVHAGDCVIDVGANIGHYTCRLSDLVGPDGRVFAFEPIPQTLEVLASNVARLRVRNVTLLNLAASDSAGIVGMSIPKFDTGLDNFYMAQISDDAPQLNVATMPIDALAIDRPVSFAKIDAEGHELAVLKGMRKLLEEHKPALVVEDNSPDLREYVAELGYRSHSITGSSNRIYEYESESADSNDASGYSSNSTGGG